MVNVFGSSVAKSSLPSSPSVKFPSVLFFECDSLTGGLHASGSAYSAVIRLQLFPVFRSTCRCSPDFLHFTLATFIRVDPCPSVVNVFGCRFAARGPWLAKSSLPSFLSVKFSASCSTPLKYPARRQSLTQKVNILLNRFKKTLKILLANQ